MSIKKAVRELSKKWLGVEKCPFAFLHGEKLRNSCNAAVDFLGKAYDDWSKRLLDAEIHPIRMFSEQMNCSEEIALCLEECLEISSIEGIFDVSDGHRRHMQDFLAPAVKSVLGNISAFIRDHYNQYGVFPSLEDLALLEEDLVENQTAIGGLPARIAIRVRNALLGIAKTKRSAHSFGETPGKINSLAAVRVLGNAEGELLEAGNVLFDSKESGTKIEPAACPALERIPNFTRLVFLFVKEWYEDFLTSPERVQLESGLHQAFEEMLEQKRYHIMDQVDEEKSDAALKAGVGIGNIRFQEGKPYHRGQYTFYAPEEVRTAMGNYAGAFF